VSKLAHKRIIKLDGPLNFRDIGGYQNENGKTVKWNKIYRSDSLSSLSASDQKRLAQLRITTDCDLRSQYEKNSAPDILWANVKLVDVPVYAEVGVDKSKEHYNSQFLGQLPSLNNNFMGRIYQQTLLNAHSQTMFAKVFAELLTLPEEEALVYHCSAGKDRTGMVSVLVLMALGIADDTIARDYLLTNQLYDFAVSRQLPSNDEISQMVAKMNVTKGEGIAIKGITETIRQGWGDFATFFKKELGFSTIDYQQLRKMYLV
jgi:protein-tyrosine phosphatase